VNPLWYNDWRGAFDLDLAAAQGKMSEAKANK
jgi:hypothetical protein